MIKGVLSACMSEYHGCAWDKRSLEEDIGFPGPGVTDSIDSQYRCWEFNLSPVEGLSVLLTDEPLLQPLSVF